VYQARIKGLRPRKRDKPTQGQESEKSKEARCEPAPEQGQGQGQGQQGQESEARREEARKKIAEVKPEMETLRFRIRFLESRVRFSQDAKNVVELEETKAKMKMKVKEYRCLMEGSNGLCNAARRLKDECER
jgi:hypothetical protein